MGTIVYYWIANAIGGAFTSADLDVLELEESDVSRVEEYMPAHTEFFPWTLNFVRETIDVVFNGKGTEHEQRKALGHLKTGFQMAQRLQGTETVFADGPMAVRMFYGLFAAYYDNVSAYIYKSSELEDHPVHGSVLNLIQLSAVGGIINRLKNAPVIICDPNSKALERRGQIIKAREDQAVDDKLDMLAEATKDVGIYSFWMGGISQENRTKVAANPDIQIMGAGFSHFTA